MQKVSSVLNKKINHFTTVLIFNGIVVFILGVLIIWTDFMLRFIMGLIVIIIAYMFFYGAYKARQLKKILNKYIKF